MAEKRTEMGVEEKKLIVSISEQGVSARKITEMFRRNRASISRVFKHHRAADQKKTALDLVGRQK